MVALIQNYYEELGEWLKLLIPKLVAKCANEVLESNKEKYRTMLEAIRVNFDPEKQLLAVCKFIRDPVRNSVSPKVILLYRKRSYCTDLFCCS